MGCYNMILSIYIKDYSDNKQEGKLDRLLKKVQKLDNQFSIVFKNNKQIKESRSRFDNFTRSQQL